MHAHGHARAYCKHCTKSQIYAYLFSAEFPSYTCFRRTFCFSIFSFFFLFCSPKNNATSAFQAPTSRGSICYENGSGDISLSCLLSRGFLERKEWKKLGFFRMKRPTIRSRQGLGTRRVTRRSSWQRKTNDFDSPGFRCRAPCVTQKKSYSICDARKEFYGENHRPSRVCAHSLTVRRKG